tara:strand:+ start:463 stop:903 length:441 start_codon:yes stop_codon:yes gene_type:complete
MFGHASISETSFGDVGGILQAGIAEMSAIGAIANAGAGTISGVATLIPAFIQTSTGLYVSGSSNAELDFNYTKTSVGVRLKVGQATLEPDFTQDSDGSTIFSGVATKTGVFSQSGEGGLLFENIAPDADESYTTITPSGTETWTEI